MQQLQLGSVCFSWVLCLLLAGCGQGQGGTQVAHDFSTPEGAILCLEDAYRAKDIEAAVKCKDFRTEARHMLMSLSMPKDQIDEELIGKTAEVLELGFRKELEQEGFPDFNGVASTFAGTEPAGDNLVTVTEECSHPGGQKSTNRLLVGKTDSGWRVLNPVSD